MARGREEKLWDHTAALQHQIASMFRDPKSGKIPFHTFHPFAEQPRPPKIKDGRVLWM